MKTIIRFICSFLFLTCFSSCSIHLYYFLRNFTDEPVTVTIKNEGKIVPLRPFVFYTPGILEIKRNNSLNLKDSLPLTQTDNSSISFTVPPRSTSFCIPPFTIYADSFRQMKIIIQQKYFSDTINLSERNKLKSKGRSFYYDVRSEIVPALKNN